MRMLGFIVDAIGATGEICTQETERCETGNRNHLGGCPGERVWAWPRVVELEEGKDDPSVSYVEGNTNRLCLWLNVRVEVKSNIMPTF